MKNLIKKIKLNSSKNIIIIGDIMLDEYIFGSVSRISPEAPVPVLLEEKRDWSLGGAANVALNCKRIGCNVKLIGIINNSDAAGLKILHILSKNSIDTKNLLKSKNRKTTVKKRIVSNTQQLLRIDNENNEELNKKEFIAIIEKLKETISKESIILISDYAKGIINNNLIQTITKIALKNHCKILVDPKGKNFEKYKNVNYIKPNYKEYLLMLDSYRLSKKNSIIANGKTICNKLSIDGLIITLGEKGIQFISMDEDIFVPAIKKNVYDLTGAGDTVFAFISLGLSVGLKIQECLELANNAASVAISHLKTYAVSLDELLDKDQFFSEKIFNNWVDLKIKLDWLKLEKNKIVFTNGCFDLLHSGHLHLLSEAKKQGDILVVALNSDDSVKRLKGNLRPIKTLNERMNIIASIGIVDFVVAFNQDTPQELIKYTKPDVLVKGGDYNKNNIVGAKFIKKNGGKIHIVDFKSNLSTSNIIKSLKEASI